MVSNGRYGECYLRYFLHKGHLKPPDCKPSWLIVWALLVRDAHFDLQPKQRDRQAGLLFSSSNCINVIAPVGVIEHA